MTLAAQEHGFAQYNLRLYFRRWKRIDARNLGQTFESSMWHTLNAVNQAAS